MNAIDGLVYGACTGGLLMLGALALRDMRRRAAMRHRRRLAIRGLAYAMTWGDRSNPSNPRHALYRHAMLGAYRALDELASVRAAMEDKR